MAETPINRAYEYLYNKAISREYLSGQELNEKRLLEETSFGRTPLWETPLMLQSESLIKISSCRRMWIIVFTGKSIDDLCQTYKLTEPTACRKYITLYFKSRLLGFQKAFEWAEDAPGVEEYRTDTSLRFHLTNITDNSILIDMYHSIMVHQMCMVAYAAMQDSSDRAGNLKQHKAIINVLPRENEENVRNAIVLCINHPLIKSLELLRNSDRQV